MSKFFILDDNRIINIDNISNINCHKESHSFGFSLAGENKSFVKECKNEEEFSKVHALLLEALKPINLSDISSNSSASMFDL